MNTCSKIFKKIKGIQKIKKTKIQIPRFLGWGVGVGQLDSRAADSCRAAELPSCRAAVQDPGNLNLRLFF